MPALRPVRGVGAVGARIDEDDHPALRTMRSCIAFLTR
jgi:hypothetical protein